ncbi:hypothetical protein [Mycolicibacterium fortuitum]|uniref:Uncharacterized protein n=1 Tax=Mycolicibacterium fortuitum TaxID=1766 RepID=A0AAE4V6N2_MYCFO|nr:hypothetical protein [Mycolicibacterium fortuitum]MDV7194655.1 hypothetical protein [Mycolicibacterium fortuitum]MDV7208654.1 hypothetical protein [Mycolicibacterium fortuitum]MDV7230551.1 hypothetical protein [Mycolicibacterium fortuitum]MDV7261842.1 hypothetical protein [Mycolicibacterium fortuitum]MDV7287048.1 hypothetical protein [Mycolicibacterium fortuitum]
MSGIDDLLALDIDEATRPWAFSLQDIVRDRAARKISDDEALRLTVIALSTAVMDLEERLNKLEGKPEGLGQSG